MKTITRLLATFLLLSALACGGDDDGATDGQDNPDAAPGADGGNEIVCVEDPTTHLEIINGCTDAEFVDKDPDLPLLNDDGTVPDPLVCE